MAYCQECGSEVAPIDIFCPYCGISLQSVLPEQDSEQSEEISSLSQTENASADEPQTEINSHTEETLVHEETPVSSISDSKTFTDEPYGDFGDFSGEVIVPENSPISEESQKPSKNTFEGRVAMKTESIELSLPSEEYKISEPDSVEKIGFPELSEDLSDKTPHETEKVDADNKSFEPAIEVSPDNSEKINTDSEFEEFEDSEAQLDLRDLSEVSDSAELDNKGLDSDNSETIEDSDFSATIPYSPPAFQSSESQSVTEEYNAEQKPFVNNSLSNEENQPDEDSLLENVNQDEGKKIGLPDTPMPEPVVPTPLYISIQPKDQSSNPEDFIVNKTPAAQSFGKAELPVQQESKEGRSFTSPNIAGSDTDGKKAAKLKPLEEGTVLNGRYEIVRKIGGGGMGAVYLASDQNLGGVLRAVKEMVQSYIEEEQQEKAINDFRRESMILSTLDHPSIPTIYDYFYDEKESRFYLVMKYINGGDLSARLRSAPEGRLDEKTVTEWAIQIADVLDYLHNRPTTIIYRDLKPSNVMIDGNSGRIMLIDFGIARSVNKEEKGVTAVGTMGYAPPELFSGNVEPRSDIYSLGSTMFHLLTGADPQSNPLLIFDFNKNPRPRQINSRLSDQMEQIITRAVEYNSGQRFNSAVEMRETLAKHLENLQKGLVTYGVSNVGIGKASQVSMPVFCGFCGQKIVATDMFCPFCGAQQPIASQAPSSQLSAGYTAPKQTARLMVIGTNELDAPEFSLEKETNLVGRRDPMSNIFPEVDLSKFDPQTKISRKHARIWRESNSYMLEDLGSSNGTVLMPPAKDSIRLLPRQPHILTHGDKIRVGDTTLHFFVG